MTHSHFSTELAAKGGTYYGSPSSFFAFFPDAWARVGVRVRKLETRQTYREPGNPAWEALQIYGIEAAAELITTVRHADFELYSRLRQRGVDFVRCRPVSLPPTEYLRFAFCAYVVNSGQGERILISRADLEAFRTSALHDFMVFDEDFAVIHDYDRSGEIRGGWVVTRLEDIAGLITVFDSVVDASVPFGQFLGEHPGIIPCVPASA